MSFFKPFRFIATLILLSVMVVSCSEDEPLPENEEAVTEMKLVFVNSTNPNDIAEAIYSDPDGPGEQQGTFEVPDLRPGVLYNVRIEMRNQLRNRNVSEFISQNADRYQFFFTQGTPAFSSIEYADEDSTGNPIGLQMRMRAGTSAGSGTLRVSLLRDPNKTAQGVRTGSMINAGGELRLQINFGIRVLGGGI
jgi:hypothetical protein